MEINLNKALASKMFAYIPVIIFTATNALPCNPLLSFATLIIICTLPGYSLLNHFNLRLRTGFENLFISVLLSIFTLSIVYTTITLSAFHLGFPHTLQKGPTFLIGLLLIIASSRNFYHSGQSDTLMQRVEIMLRNVSPQAGVLITFAVFLPIASFIVVSQLNRGGSSAASIVFLCFCIAVLLMLFSSLFTVGSTPIHYALLYSVIFALLIQTSFRGDGGFWGYDVNAEYAVANRTLLDGFWIPINDKNSYHSMLSITVLPVVLSLLSKLSLGIIFKLFYASVAALLPLAIYAILIKYVRKAIAMSVICTQIIGSLSFIVSMTALCRQVIGTAFFIGVLMAILTQDWSRNTRFTMIIILSFGLAFSHYSSAYVLCSILLPASAFIFLVKLAKNRYRWSFEPILTIPLALAILGMTLIWNAGINHSIQDSSSLFSTVNRLGIDLLPSKQQSFMQRWIQGVSVSTETSPEEYKNFILGATKDKYPTAKIRESALAYKLTLPDYPKDAPPLGTFVPTVLAFLYIGFNTLFQILVLVFCLIHLSMFRKRVGRRLIKIPINSDDFQSIRTDLTALTLLGLLFAILLRSSNSIAHFYNPERAAFQMAFIFSLPIAILLEKFFTRYSVKEPVLWWVLPFCGFLFIQHNSGIFDYLSGSTNARISNAIAPSMQFVISAEEKAASNWLGDTLLPTSIIQTDSYARLVITQNDQIPVANLIPQIAPFGLLVNSYVYLSAVNLKSGIAICPGLNNEGYVRFTAPIDYFKNNLSLVYSSRGSRVYR